MADFRDVGARASSRPGLRPGKRARRRRVLGAGQRRPRRGPRVPRRARRLRARGADVAARVRRPRRVAGRARRRARRARRRSRSPTSTRTSSASSSSGRRCSRTARPSSARAGCRRSRTAKRSGASCSPSPARVPISPGSSARAVARRRRVARARPEGVDEPGRVLAMRACCSPAAIRRCRKHRGITAFGLDHAHAGRRGAAAAPDERRRALHRGVPRRRARPRRAIASATPAKAGASRSRACRTNGAPSTAGGTSGLLDVDRLIDAGAGAWAALAIPSSATRWPGSSIETRVMGYTARRARDTARAGRPGPGRIGDEAAREQAVPRLHRARDAAPRRRRRRAIRTATCRRCSSPRRRSRSAAAPTRSSATSSANACSACPRSRASTATLPFDQLPRYERSGTTRAHELLAARIARRVEAQVVHHVAERDAACRDRRTRANRPRPRARSRSAGSRRRTTLRA